MTPRYRDATAADLPAIDRLFRDSFTATFGHLYSRRNLAAFLGGFTPTAWAAEFATMRFRVAEAKGGLLGYAKLSAVSLPVTPAGAAAELRQLYLAERAKGIGVADALIDWTVARARQGGAGELFLSVYIDNHRARRVYERHGFRDIGPYAFKVGDHEDEDRIMRLAL